MEVGAVFLPRRLVAVVAVAVAVAGFASPARSQASKRSAAPPTSRPTACAAAASADEPVSLEEAFAHPIEDGRTLRLLARLATMDGARQRSVLVNVRKLGAAPSSVPSDYEAGCRSELALRTLRAMWLIASRWNVDTRDATFDSLARRVEIAIGSGDGDVDLAPFGLRESDLASTDEAPTAPCTGLNRTSRVRRPSEPAYPSSARFNETTGTISLHVALDSAGLVRSVTVAKTEVRGPAARALVDASIVSAATTVYDPEIRACEPIAGTYLFRAQFSKS